MIALFWLVNLPIHILSVTDIVKRFLVRQPTKVKSVRKPGSKKSQERLRHIIEAALACFARSGFAKATLADIAHEASIRPGLLYYYFKSKEDLIAYAIQDTFARSKELGDQIIHAPNTLEAILDTMYDENHETMLDDLKISERITMEILSEAMRNERVRDIVVEHFRGTALLLKGILEIGQQRGQVDPAVNPADVATLWTATSIGVRVVNALGSRGEAERLFANSKALFRGLLAPGVPPRIFGVPQSAASAATASDDFISENNNEFISESSAYPPHVTLEPAQATEEVRTRRPIGEILRLKHEAGWSDSAIARRLGTSRAIVAACIQRAAAAALQWPLPAGHDDAALDLLLFPGSGAVAGTRRKPQPDWPSIHRALQAPGGTLSQQWTLYRAAAQGGYGFSRFCDLYRAWLDRPASSLDR
ncbi:MAG TPA: TetR family transcriptional regulator [Aliidongia sp.]|uniref:TetR family transcriptional regulator n=1 Tax=Aliidongia sp. TaxID=1914230 RepID=UPI002DDD774A|nr:TetR family transcriptional regulator [Aliidongia sp.]HEV2676067.1 TetR family transcriptional regulator [Aliidongia sp.]